MTVTIAVISDRHFACTALDASTSLFRYGSYLLGLIFCLILITEFLLMLLMK